MSKKDLEKMSTILSEMYNNDTPRVVRLEIESRPEYYHGEPTGETEWRASIVREDDTDNRLGGVLGRSTRGPQSAVSDWNYRAEGDGHKVKGVIVER